MELVWSSQVWDDYLRLRAQDRRVLKRINALLKDIQRNGNEGIGTPAALRKNLSGY